MHELLAMTTNNFLFICTEDGRMFNLTDAIGHAVRNQYKVEDDISLKFGRKLDYEDMQKVSARKTGRRF